MNVSSLHESEMGGIDSANVSMPEAVFSPGVEPGLTPNGERRKVALLTGITGQDGSYLAEFLLEKVCAGVSDGLNWVGVGLGCLKARAVGLYVWGGAAAAESCSRTDRVCHVAAVVCGDPD